MDNDIEKLLGLRQDLIEYHEAFYTFVTETLDRIKNNQYTVEQLCDLGFLCRKLEVYFEELRKIAKGRKELCVKIMGFFLATQSVEDPTKCQDRIEGDLAYARIAAKVIPRIPKKDDPNYIGFMESLGVPVNLLEGGLVKADFRGVAELVTGLVREGKKLPPGVEKTWTEYTANFYERKK